VSGSRPDLNARVRGNKRTVLLRRGRRGGGAVGRDSTVGSPSRGSAARRRGSSGNAGPTHQSAYEFELALALEREYLGDDIPHFTADEWPARAATLSHQTVGSRSQPSYILRRPSASDLIPLDDSSDGDGETGGRFGRNPSFDRNRASFNDTALDSYSFDVSRNTKGSMMRSRDKSDHVEGKDLTRTLECRGAVATLLYRSVTPDPKANDIWPECRSSAKLPARYSLLDKDKGPSSNSAHWHGSNAVRKQRSRGKGKQPMKDDDGDGVLPDVSTGRPKWDLPVELVEMIADYLNRDDIKSLRLVSHELNGVISQVVFKTVVVPFNTEIYGMLGHEKKIDIKGKKRAKIDRPGYSWKNANGDEVYNGHGLDVFKGFGRHIRRYGMSFEVNEDSLAQPPIKSLTEQKTSFWGNYDWPFEEYRRFDAVAGLETAADETPRMKTAFSELTRVKELALSLDSGLGWLNGPDRSIRARILQRPPEVFGTLKDIPDRRAQAQQELWAHIEESHLAAGCDVRLATLYRLDGLRPLSATEEANVLAEEQPEMPFLDQHLIHEAIPHDVIDVPLPHSFDDPDVLHRFVLAPPSSNAGVLFTSISPPADAGQVMSPVIPATLTKAQKEWLMETEWAQRAFMSSYMLSIIDNPDTFTPVHTLNISRLSDRYLPMLNRADFWDALPHLANLTLLVVPGWRTVYKDEAGFVDTPKINPTSGVDPFCNLLSNHVAARSRIKNVTIGWTAGGEHAEGLYARNRLLMPAPLMRLGVNAENNSVFASDMLTVLDADRLSIALVHLPHVERLTLKNCWTTPATLLQFVKIHDLYNLKHLVLDSVSLTALLRPNAVPNPAGQQAAVFQNGPLAGALAALFNAANNAGGQGALGQAQAAWMNHNAGLQLFIPPLMQQLQQLQANAVGVQQQNQITALQTQLQQHVLQQHNHGQNQNQAQNQQLSAWQPQAQALNQAVPPTLPNVHAQQHAQPNQIFAIAAQVHAITQQITAAAANPGGTLAAAPATLAQPNGQPAANGRTTLQSPPREGSWMHIIDIISPGTNLGDFQSTHSKANPDRQTALQSIEFISCGYTKLTYAATLEQPGIDHANGFASALRNPYFNRRSNALSSAMLSAKWAHLGEIVQEVDQEELAALDAGWNLRTGWDDMEEARGPEFDGLLPGGHGRFTGVVRREDRVGDEAR
jgi:hypothetical protein